MNIIRTYLLNYPLIGILIILPFTMMFTLAIFSLILDIVLPGLLALWLAGWVYTSVTGQHWRRNIHEPFWFVEINTNKL